MTQKWEELGLSDNFIFQKVMLNEELCKKILSEILGKEVTGIDYSAYEKTVEIRRDAKGIRLDVYIKDEEKTIYNVEIQNTDMDNLPKRSRYYHDLIDLDLMEKGEPYESLNHSYVIFICNFDIFGKGCYKYTFQNRCMEEEGLELGDGSTTIFMNTGGYKGDISKDCEVFLYMPVEPFEAFPKEFHVRRKTHVAFIACGIGHADVKVIKIRFPV